MIVTGMLGLGDNIYQRAFIKKLTDIVYLSTPWPELYSDLPNVRFNKPQTQLRTQLKNIMRNTSWAGNPIGGYQIRVSYGGDPIFSGMRRCFGFDPDKMDLPDFGMSRYDKPYVVVRPVTVRSEWMAAARNPLSKYVTQAAEKAKAAGYIVVSVADLQSGREWADELPLADFEFNHGELDTIQLLNLTQNAAALIGGIGWIVPAAMAQNKKALVICGGQGGYNHPDRITDANQSHEITFAMPDNFCMCKQREHSCDKTISNIQEIIDGFIESI